MVDNNINNKQSPAAAKGIRYKLRIAFYMSFLPLLSCIYIILNYIFPNVGLNIDMALYIIANMLICLAGFLLVKNVFGHISALSKEARIIVNGNLDHRIDSARKDEMGELADSLNQLTQRIRDKVEELKNYGQKTTELNLEIQRRILVLSSLLEISSLISQNSKLDDILKLTLEKARLITNSDVVYLLFREEGIETFSMRIAEGINLTQLLQINIEPEDALFSRVIKTHKPLIIDKQRLIPKNLEDIFLEKFKLKNTIALPIHLKNKLIGIFGIGNNEEEFLYMKDDIELLDIFAKQIAIAVENDALANRVQKLEIKDALTGLYNEAFIRNCLREEIRRAIIYRRPCAFVLINVDNFKLFAQNSGTLQAEAALKKIATLVKDSVTEVDRVARIGNNEFAIVLPERNKRQAQGVAEEIRKKIEFSFSEEREAGRKFTVSAGVSENPLDGVEAEELMVKAKQALSMAKSQGKNRVVV